jgi:hypothetical protein
MELRALPAAASWTHSGARVGFEVLFSGAGRLRGRTSAREGDAFWYVGYEITVGADWSTESVNAVNSTISGDHEVALTRFPDDHWTVNGVARPDLDDRGHVFHYESATFDFECELTFDASGLVLDYPGIAIRDR